MKRTAFAAASVLVLVWVMAAGPATATSHAGTVRIDVLSNRADLISGGGAYVRIDVPSGQPPSGLHVTLNGHDASRFFARRPNGQTAREGDG